MSALATIIWTAGLLVFGYLAQFNVHWLWGSSVMLAAQWFTDSFDGALGRLRDTGIPKWGLIDTRAWLTPALSSRSPWETILGVCVGT